MKRKNYCNGKFNINFIFIFISNIHNMCKFVIYINMKRMKYNL